MIFSIAFQYVYAYNKMYLRACSESAYSYNKASVCSAVHFNRTAGFSSLNKNVDSHLSLMRSAPLGRVSLMIYKVPDSNREMYRGISTLLYSIDNFPQWDDPTGATQGVEALVYP